MKRISRQDRIDESPRPWKSRRTGSYLRIEDANGKLVFGINAVLQADLDNVIVKAVGLFDALTLACTLAHPNATKEAAQAIDAALALAGIE